MADNDVTDRINELIDEEHRLRERVQRGDMDPGEESQRLRAVQERLDQCWDLLRQRRAQREFAADPAAATALPTRDVENYQQ